MTAPVTPTAPPDRAEIVHTERDRINTLIADMIDARLFLASAQPKIRKEARARFEAARTAILSAFSALQARIEALEAGLRPFAAEAKWFDDIPGVYRCHDNLEIWQKPTYQYKITVGDLRRARSLIQEGGK